MPQVRYRFGEFELDPASRELWRNGSRIALPPKSFECLAYLIAHRERAVGRDELISAVWGRVDASDTLVAQTLLRARKALDDSGERQAMIRTVPRFGYQWAAPVREVTAPEALPSAAEPALPEPDAVPVTEATEPAIADTPASAPDAPRRPPWRLAITLGAIALLVLAGSLGVRHWRSPAPAAPAPAIAEMALVLPVRVAPADAESSWIRLGAMDYIASRVRRSGLKVLPSDQTLHLSAALQADTPTDAAAWQRLAADSGARWVLAPEASRDGNGWRVRLQWQEAAGERMVEARGNTPLSAAASATDSWLQRQGRRSRGDSPTALTERLQQIDAELTAGQLASVRRLVEQAPPAQRADPRLQVRQAQLAFRSGQIDEAERGFLVLLRAEAEPVDADVRARALMGLGAVGVRRGNYVDAQARYSQALELLQGSPEGLDDPGMLGNAYNGRGVARVEQNQMEGAVQDLGMARIAMQRAGDLVEAAMVGTNLGMIEHRRGHDAQAVAEFDRAIATYERFGVHDYLAATLSAKAETQLSLAQPGPALASARRARAESKALEDARLALRVDLVNARALLQNGQLREAEATLQRLQAAGLHAGASPLADLRLALHLARGQTREAAAQARTLAADPAIDGSLFLLVTQAALRARDGEAIAASRRSTAAAAADDADTQIAAAMLEAGSGHRDTALARISAVAERAARDGRPDARVRAGVAQALMLLDAAQPQAAAAILGGDLAAYAGSDYRVAWSMLALYRALGDSAQLERARAQAEALRGERPLDMPPPL